MDTIVLIDLSSLAHPLWHTCASSANPDETSQQIVARVHALASGNRHVAICMDSGRSFRHDVDASYKGNRPEREAALHHQIAIAVEALEADGFPIWKVAGFEADDIIATAALKAMELDGVNVQIVTGDKDLLQLVCDRVSVKSARDGTVLDEAGVFAKFGVTPAQMRDFLTLVGDSSDNVKGVPGIGAKRAVGLLTLHGSIDAIYAQMARGVVPGVTPAMRTALVEFQPQLPTTRTLITLRTDVEIPFNEIAAERTPREPERFDFGDDDTMAPETPDTVTETATQPADAAAEQPVSPAPNSAPQPTAIATRKPDVLAPAPVEWERQLEPRSMNEARLVATDVFNSKLFMGAYGSPQAVLSTVLAGRELGLQAMASLRAIHIVEGKPTLSADLIRALVLRSGMAKYFRCTERTAERATFETQRGDDPPISLTMTIEEGRAAWAGTQEKWDKSGWGKNPADMLVARAGAKLARLVYPDVVHGLYAPEEFDRAEVA
jgi:5'-3' exonuclease